jgi:hypothetical protein
MPGRSPKLAATCRSEFGPAFTLLLKRPLLFSPAAPFAEKLGFSDNLWNSRAARRPSMQKMNRTVEVQRDLRALRTLQKRLWRHQTNWTGHLIFGSMFIVFFVALVAAGYGRSIGPWLMLGTSLIYVFLPFYSYQKTMRSADERFVQLPERSTYTFTDTGFRMTGDLAAVEVFWTGLTDILEYDEGWILEYQSKRYLLLPGTGLDEGTRQFIQGRLAENKAKAPPPEPIKPDPLDY